MHVKLFKNFKYLRIETYNKYLTSLPYIKKKVDQTQTIEDPLIIEDTFNVKNIVNLKDLFDKRVHYGHKVGTLHEKMKPYIYGERLGHLMIDLDKSLPLLYDALNITAHIAHKRGIILFLCRNYQFVHTVERFARKYGVYAHCRFWAGGVFTNADSQFNFQLPGEELNASHERDGGNGPARFSTRLPDLCIFLGANNTQFTQHRAIRDSAKVNIPTVAILDTDVDPSDVTYPVPGNDDSPESMELYMKCFGEAIERGNGYRRANNKEPNEGS